MLPALLAAAPLALQAASFIPGKAERQLRQAANTDLEMTAGGGGGMSAGERQRRQAEVAGAAHATQEQLLAQMARGSQTGAGESGAMAQAAGEVQKATAGTINRGMSDIRGQDLTLGAQRRLAAMQAKAALSQARDQKAAGLVSAAGAMPGLYATGQQIQKQNYDLGKLGNPALTQTYKAAGQAAGLEEAEERRKAAERGVV